MSTRTLAPFIALMVLALASDSLPSAEPAAQPAEAVVRRAGGVVFDDANGDGRRDPGEKGLPDVRVSNGREIVKTDAEGRYRLPVEDDTIVFVIKPGGWMTPLSADNLPRFYYIHKPAGSPKQRHPGVAPTGPLPEAIDFPLTRRDEPTKFKALLLGDTQPADQVQVDYLAHDVVEGLLGTDAAFCVSLGDLVHDDPSLFEPVMRTIGLIGIPSYNVLGNHDLYYDSPEDAHSAESFQRVYGPPYYSFDYGPVHFIVLDDVVWHGPKAGKEGDYRAGLGEKQLEFVKNDLALLPKDQLVVLMMHIPLTELAELKELFALLDQHLHTFSISAHYHFNEHRFFTKKDGWNGAESHHHLINVTTCGSWWRGTPDEVQLPHATMCDGAPNGYSLITFEGHRYSIEFRAARRPADYQMNIHAPEEIASEAAEKTEVLVNVFAGSERSKVEMRLGESGPWTPMEKTVRVDPYHPVMKTEEVRAQTPAQFRLPKRVVESPHMWMALLPKNPPQGTQLIHVRTTDMFGHVYEARRVIRVR